MKKEHLLYLLSLFLVVLCFYLLFRILLPFLGAIFWAIFVGMVSYPIYAKLQRRLGNRRILSALTMTVLVVLVLVLPFTFLFAALANEVVIGYEKVDEMIQSGRLQTHLDRSKESPAFQWVMKRLTRYVDLSQWDPLGFLKKNLRQVMTFLFEKSSTVLKGLSTFLIGFLFTLLTLYYFFRDGDELRKMVEEILPMPPPEKKLLLQRFREMVRATVYGGLLVAVIQGLLGGLTFWILGISSPVLWGTGMALLSFIPLGGTAIIWLPTSLVLMVMGALTKGIILLLVGSLIISSIDNFLRPVLVGARTRIHPLLLLFAVLGGIQTFGMIGVIAGPLIATLCVTLVEIYLQEIRGLRDSGT